MTLTDPRDALADQSSFIAYLMGLAALARVVHVLAADDSRSSEIGCKESNFVEILLGVASLGDAIQALVDTSDVQGATGLWPAASTRWLR